MNQPAVRHDDPHATVAHRIRRDAVDTGFAVEGDSAATAPVVKVTGVV